MHSFRYAGLLTHSTPIGGTTLPIQQWINAQRNQTGSVTSPSAGKGKGWMILDSVGIASVSAQQQPH